MSKIRKFAGDVSWAFCSSVITLSIAFLLRMFIARWLGASELGLYQMLLTIYGLAILPATFGIPVAITKYVADFKDHDEKLNQIITSSIISSVALGALIGIILFTLSKVLAALFHMPGLAHLIQILAIILPFTSLFQALIGLYNGLRRMRLYAFISILQYFLMIVCTAILVVAGYGVKGAVIGLIISMIVACVVSLYASRKLFKFSFQKCLQTMVEITGFGSLLLGGNIVNVIANQADILLIGYFLVKKDVGLYSVAISLSMFMTLIPMAIQRITYPATAEYYSKKHHSGLDLMIDKSIKYSTIALLPIGLGIGFFAEEIITLLFGQQFRPATSPLIVLLIARVIRGGTNVPVGGSVTAAGRPDIMFMISLISAISNVLLNILLIPKYGITGAAIATTISLLLGTVIFLIIMPRVLQVRTDLAWFGQIYGFAFIAIILFTVLSKILSNYLSGVLVLLVFSMFIIRFALTKDDKHIFKSLIYSFMLGKE